MLTYIRYGSWVPRSSFQFVIFKRARLSVTFYAYRSIPYNPMHVVQRYLKAPGYTCVNKLWLLCIIKLTSSSVLLMVTGICVEVLKLNRCLYSLILALTPSRNWGPSGLIIRNYYTTYICLQPFAISLYYLHLFTALCSLVILLTSVYSPLLSRYTTYICLQPFALSLYYLHLFTALCSLVILLTSVYSPLLSRYTTYICLQPFALSLYYLHLFTALCYLFIKLTSV
jgi:hypothetical protein